MTTFLELVNDTAEESGTVDATQRLTTLVGISGRQQTIMRHVIDAWRLIQTSRTDWDWRINTFESDLVIGQMEYAGSDFSITDFERWEKPTDKFNPYSIYDNSIGRGDETKLKHEMHRYWRDNYDFGAPDNNRPIIYSFGTNRKLCIGPPPSQAFKIRGGYHRSVQILAVDADVPICPEGHHHIIQWRALMLLAGRDEANEAYQNAASQYAQSLRNLVQIQSQVIEFG